MSFPKLRFAPSPTGFLHLGNIRAALFNWLVAKQNSGSFFLRVDDTDPERSQQTYVDQILLDLHWLRLEPQKIFRQSERLHLYQKAIEALKKQGRLYPCYETSEELAEKRTSLKAMGKPPLYDRSALSLSEKEKQDLEAEGRKPHWRFLLKDERVHWDDLMRGPVSVSEGAVSDPIVVREEGQVSFLLAGAVDDLDMGVTHIIRGEDHMTNTGVQIQMMRALLPSEGVLPVFGHFSLLSFSGGELSKRSGSLSVKALRDQGFLPEGLLSYLVSLGTGLASEIVASPESLLPSFDLSRFSRSSAHIDLKNLRALNQKMLRELPLNDLQSAFEAYGISKVSDAFWTVCHESCETLEDVLFWCNVCEGSIPSAAVDDFPSELSKGILTDTLPPSPWTEETWSVWAENLMSMTGLKRGKIFFSLRKILTGRSKGPEMRLLLPLIGKERVLKRLKSILSSQPAAS